MTARRCARLRICSAAVTLVACASEQEPSSATSSSPQKTVVALGHDETSDAPFRYLPTFREHLESEVQGQPVLELVQPGSGRLRVVAAISRPSASMPTLELYTYDQRNQRAVLEPSSPPVPIVRVRAEDHPSRHLAQFRRELSAPASTLHRPLGIAVQTPDDLVERLVRDTELVNDPNAGPSDRLHALVDLVRGVDDAMIFHRDEMPELMASLARPTVRTAHVETLGPRRARVSIASATDATTLDLERRSGGWVIAEMTRRKGLDGQGHEASPSGKEAP